jgi:hypothetical protein
MNRRNEPREKTEAERLTKGTPSTFGTIPGREVSRVTRRRRHGISNPQSIVEKQRRYFA